jgi:hypothetical protein
MSVRHSRIRVGPPVLRSGHITTTRKATETTSPAGRRVR